MHERWETLLVAVLEIIYRDRCTLRQLAQIAGLLVSMHAAMGPVTRLFLDSAAELLRKKKERGPLGAYIFTRNSGKGNDLRADTS
jgi:hypothetical protein